MDPLINSVESLWNFVISIIWRLWICFAVIVFVHVQFGIGSYSSNATSERNNTKVTKNFQSASVRKIIKTAKQLLRLNKLDDANETLNKGTLLFEDEVENSGSESIELRFWVGRLHEIKSLCLYCKDDVIGSMVEMDRGLAVVQNPDSHLLRSANHCFQLFHKWCGENFDHFQQDIVMYFQDKKTRIEAGTVQKIANTSLLLQSVHCLILSEFLVKCAFLEEMESTDIMKLCQQFFSLLKSEEGDDETLNSFNSSGNEVKYKDLVKQDDDRPVLKGVQKGSGSESLELLQQLANQEIEEGPLGLKNLTKELHYLEPVGEGHARTLAEVRYIEEFQGVDIEAETLEPVVDSCGLGSCEHMQKCDNRGKSDVVRKSSESRNMHVIQHVEASDETANDFMVCEYETVASDSKTRSNAENEHRQSEEHMQKCDNRGKSDVVRKSSESRNMHVIQHVEASDETANDFMVCEYETVASDSKTRSNAENEHRQSEDEVETGASGDNKMECSEFRSEDGQLVKSEENMGCGESQDAEAEHSKSEDGVKICTLVGGEVKVCMSEDSEMEHCQCVSGGYEVNSCLSRDSGKSVEPESNPGTSESIDPTVAGSSCELEEQMAENELAEPCQAKPVE